MWCHRYEGQQVETMKRTGIPDDDVEKGREIVIGVRVVTLALWLE